MSAVNPFPGYSSTLDGPAENFFAVTPSDSADLPFLVRSLYVGGGGDISVLNKDGQTVVFRSVPAGTVLPIRTGRVRASGTTATLLVGLY